MLFSLVCLAALGGFAWYVMTPAERAHCLERVRTTIHSLLDAAAPWRRRPEPLADLLRSRTPLAIVTPALAAGYVIVYIGLLTGPAATGETEMLLAWGASTAPLTTQGEWWRLAASSFVHAGVLALVINLGALVSVGAVLERLVGPVAFTAVYLAAAVLGGVAGLSASPMTVMAGAAPAIFGLYGLLLASWTWGAVQQATTTVRLRTVCRLTPAAAFFVVYHTGGTGVPGPAEQMGIATGFVVGLVLAKCLRETKPETRRIALTAAATACFAVLAAVPLRGVVDLRPEIERLAALEQRHAGIYGSAVDEFRRGVSTRAALVEVIEGAILPELVAPRSRLATFAKVAPEQRPMLVAAETYLRLREEAWRVRASALRDSRSAMLREADEREQAALTALRAINP